MVLAQWVAAVALNFAASATLPLYLQLDGIYYAVPAGGTVEYIGDAWVVTQNDPATAQCDRRGNGLVQQFRALQLVALFNCWPNLMHVVSGISQAAMPAWARRPTKPAFSHWPVRPGTFSAAVPSPRPIRFLPTASTARSRAVRLLWRETP